MPTGSFKITFPEPLFSSSKLHRRDKLWVKSAAGTDSEISTACIPIDPPAPATLRTSVKDEVEAVLAEYRVDPGTVAAPSDGSREVEVAVNEDAAGGRIDVLLAFTRGNPGDIPPVVLQSCAGDDKLTNGATTSVTTSVTEFRKGELKHTLRDVTPGNWCVDRRGVALRAAIASPHSS